MRALTKTFLLTLCIIFVALSLIKVIGNIVNKDFLPFLEQTSPKMGKEAGELIVLICLLQISLLVVVIKNKWNGIKSLIAGTLAGLLLLPTAAIFEINSTISLISQGNPYSTLNTTSPEITELRVGDTKITLPTSLVQEIKTQYPAKEIISPKEDEKRE